MIFKYLAEKIADFCYSATNPTTEQICMSFGMMLISFTGYIPQDRKNVI